MMETPLKVLLVEDRQEDAILVERELRRGGLSVTCARVETGKVMRKMVTEECWDIMIADYTLPQFDGLSAFRLYQEFALDIPFIIVSGSIGEDLAVTAMKAGVHDYVMKNNLARLVPAIRRELRDAEERCARKQAEQRLRETEKLRMVGELTSSLIHDLKNPLQSILSSSELLSTGEIGPEKTVRFCSLIERQIDLILAMSEEVLDFIRGEIRLNLKPTEIDSLVTEIVDTFEGSFAKAGVTLACRFESTTSRRPVAVCDRLRIWRALQNLISNAKDAMPEGGTITFRVACDEGKTVIEIADTGKGIPEEIRGRLFEPFVTAGKRHGTGLGLAIVKNIIDAHRGSITFESSATTGTTFRIELPSELPLPQDSQQTATVGRRDS